MTYAVVFPGQGSQQVGMLAEMAQAFPVVRDIFAQASDVLAYDLWHLVRDDPQAQLNTTEFTQPALLVASVSLWRVLENILETPPAVLAGHSLGEYSALVCAQAMTLEQAVQAVRMRGRLMQQAVASGVGAMAAIIGLDDEKIEALCEQEALGHVLSAANFNAKGQVVVAGHKVAIERLVVAAKEAGARMTKVLDVSVPSHCALMQPAVAEMQDVLQSIELNPPRIPVIHNVDALSHADDVNAIRSALLEQLAKPVQWVKTITRLHDYAVEAVIECGPQKVLQGLIKRTDKSFQLFAFNEPSHVEALAKLF